MPSNFKFVTIIYYKKKKNTYYIIWLFLYLKRNLPQLFFKFFSISDPPPITYIIVLFLKKEMFLNFFFWLAHWRNESCSNYFVFIARNAKLYWTACAFNFYLLYILYYIWFHKFFQRFFLANIMHEYMTIDRLVVWRWMIEISLKYKTPFDKDRKNFCF